MARIKNIEAFCAVCNGVRKMELTGDLSVNETNTKQWAKCKKCKQTMLIDLAQNAKETKISLEGIENQDCTLYSPQKSFNIGEAIYHKNWDDFGKVVSKNILSNGQKSIVVEFQKSGHKNLVESFNI